MSILDTVETNIKTDEAAVVSFFAKLNAGIQQAEAQLKADLDVALQWVEAHGAETSQIILGVVTAVAADGVGVPASVLLAAQFLNTGVASVNAAIAASQSGGGGTFQQAAAAGSAAYTAFNQAKSALASPATKATAP